MVIANMSSRKRVISSCIPCYTRKQKCNREYPCFHCTRRGCVEECVYYSAATSLTSRSTDGLEFGGDERSGNKDESASRNEWSPNVKHAMSTGPWSALSLAGSFGYFEYSNNNTLALIQKLGLARNDSSFDGNLALFPDAADDVHRNIQRMPDRQILDFLVQYFVAEINWMDQLVHVPWFLSKYHAWGMLDEVKLVSEVDFTILVLRICSYALQFLPSPGYPLDKIRGVLLADVRSKCDETADSLEAISIAADGRGSLIRLQQLAFLGLKCQIEEKMSVFWEVLSRAIRVAQSVGIHSDAARSRDSMNVADQEMERRIFCNLYIWDSVLSRQLDRIPLLPGRLPAGNWPQLHMESEGGSKRESNGGVPDPFTERLLQARLADFWRNVGPSQGSEYDVVAAEDRYDKFCREYLSQLPRTFALVEPDEAWDKASPKLPLQRKLLHIAIYESLCWNFRPLLLRQPLPLPAYKSVLLISQKKALAFAALQATDGVTQLHTLLGGCHTRLAGIVFSTFEAAVLLVYLLTDPTFPEGCAYQQRQTAQLTVLKTDPLQAGINKVTRFDCLQAAQKALKRLKILGEVSSMADLGAATLVQLLKKVSGGSRGGDTGLDETVPSIQNQDVGSSNATTTSNTTTNPPLGATPDLTSWFSYDPLDLRSATDFMSINGTLPLGNMTPWSSFDTSTIYPQVTEYLDDA